MSHDLHKCDLKHRYESAHVLKFQTYIRGYMPEVAHTHPKAFCILEIQECSHYCISHIARNQNKILLCLWKNESLYVLSIRTSNATNQLSTMTL